MLCFSISFRDEFYSLLFSLPEDNFFRQVVLYDFRKIQSHSPQTMSRVQRVTLGTTSRWSCLSDSFAIMSASSRDWAFIVAVKSSKIRKWKAGVNILLLLFHLFPELPGGWRCRRDKAKTLVTTPVPALANLSCCLLNKRRDWYDVRLICSWLLAWDMTYLKVRFNEAGRKIHLVFLIHHELTFMA